MKYSIAIPVAIYHTGIKLSLFRGAIMDARVEKTVKVDREKLQSQIDRNYNAFKKNLSRYIRLHRNRFALMRDGKVIKFCRTYESAWKTGNKQYVDGLFSIQKVTKEPMDLGFFSRA